MSRTSLRVLLGLVVVGLLVILLEWLIVTDKEKIETLLDRARAAAERGDGDAVMEDVDLAYDYQGQSFEALRDHVREGLRLLKPRKVALGNVAITVQEERAHVCAVVTTMPSERSQVPAIGQFELDIGLARKEGRWYVTSVARLE